MNILISTIFWGNEYFNDFANYSLSSLLSENNVAAVSKDNSVTILIFTEKRLIEKFKNSDIYKESLKIINYKFYSLEEYGFNPTRIPSGYHPKKYQFLSVCQNIVMDLSKPYDLHIFNYADFVWSDGALTNIISKFKANDIKALLGFCIPVDGKKVREGLLTPVKLSSYQAVNLALDNLHRETKLRNWNNDFISESPSYLYWKVCNEGIIVRAFHQTVLAVVPNQDSDLYNGGIKYGTLDSSFASDISSKGKTMIASDSEDIFIFSLYETIANSKATHKNKREVLGSFVRGAYLNKRHLASFQVPILLKRGEIIDDVWDKSIIESQKDIEFINKQISSNCGEGAPIYVKNREGWRVPTRQLKFCSYLSNYLVPKLKNFTKSQIKKILRFFSAF
jgi:hypothetical protein